MLAFCRNAASALLLAGSVLEGQAGAELIRGAILDHFTGRPLARTLVTLEKIQTNGVVKVETKTGSNGGFAFPPLTAGAYLLSAARKNYSTLKYGQKYWNAPGTAIILADDSAPYFDLRLRRLGAVTGSVWDENEIGISEQEVYAYRATRPPVQVARGRTDDRGFYRIGGLYPGRYLIRSGAKQLDEETGVLPTFYPNDVRVDDARMVEVSLDEQIENLTVRPVFGKTFTLSGEAVKIPPCDGRVSVTLSSDLDRKTVSDAFFSFNELAPGAYEIWAECAGRVPAAAYQRLQLSRDTEKLSLQLATLPTLQLSIEDQAGKPIDPQSVSIFARRKDLAGAGQPQRLKDAMPMLPGRWEFTVSPAGNSYPASISGVGVERMDTNRPDGWNEFLITTRARFSMKIVMAAGAASLRGTVTRSLNELAVGAPVYLEAFDRISQKRLVDLRKTLTGPRGEYRFNGLTPGTYRIVSSLEFEDPDELLMGEAHAVAVSLEPSSDTALDLELFTKP